MTDHHGQHKRCRACGTNPRGRVETQSKGAEPLETLCSDCGAARSWVWSPKLERSVLRACPCHSPKGDKLLSRERIAAIRSQLKERP